jgi:hypothetical protein
MAARVSEKLVEPIALVPPYTLTYKPALSWAAMGRDASSEAPAKEATMSDRIAVDILKILVKVEESRPGGAVCRAAILRPGGLPQGNW